MSQCRFDITPRLAEELKQEIVAKRRTSEHDRSHLDPPESILRRGCVDGLNLG